MDVIYFEICC